MVYQSSKAAQTVFPLCGHYSWKLEAMQAANGVQYKPHMFSFHVITRVGLRYIGIAKLQDSTATQKQCGACGTHYAPEGSAVFRHPHISTPSFHLALQASKHLEAPM